ncbi:ATP-binding protein [Ferroplasma acidiphilum]|uniref:ATP-binding protein n=1 Tax=Ferroplasma acidiphilum TaxID=74969 RepID=A0A7K4FNB9_9ARCH|nr:ATP-binding protein [Ferroplasma acidiphilum]NOL60514.1 ATP-binding protein [Ferroplasma acidiphilum]
MKIIKSMFGKETGITEGDLDKVIGIEQETSIIECKRLTSQKDIDKSVIKPLVGFLNKLDNSGGLLLLGFDAPKGKIERIVPINDNSLRQDRIRNKILDGIGSIPSAANSFTFDVIEIDVANGFVILVEVSRAHPYAVFYSKRDNQGWIRKADNTVCIEMGELFSIVGARNYPIVYPVLGRISMEVSTNGVYSCKIKILLKNKGAAPGLDIVGILVFEPKHDGTQFSIRSNNKDFEISANDKNNPKLVFKLFQPGKMPSYPQLDLDVGNFDILAPKDLEIEIKMTVYERKGLSFTTATFKNGAISQPNVTFSPYLR